MMPLGLYLPLSQQMYNLFQQQAKGKLIARLMHLCSEINLVSCAGVSGATGATGFSGPSGVTGITGTSLFLDPGILMNLKAEYNKSHTSNWRA